MTSDEPYNPKLNHAIRAYFCFNFTAAWIIILGIYGMSLLTMTTDHYVSGITLLDRLTKADISYTYKIDGIVIDYWGATYSSNIYNPDAFSGYFYSFYDPFTIRNPSIPTLYQIIN